MHQRHTFLPVSYFYMIFNWCNSDGDPGQILQLFTCWQPQREISAGSGLEAQDAVLDVHGSPLARLIVVLQDDQLHRPDLQ